MTTIEELKTRVELNEEYAKTSKDDKVKEYHQGKVDAYKKVLELIK